MRKAYALGLYEKAMPDCSWPEKLQTAKDAGFYTVAVFDSSSDCWEESRALADESIRDWKLAGNRSD